MFQNLSQNHLAKSTFTKKEFIELQIQVIIAKSEYYIEILIIFKKLILQTAESNFNQSLHKVSLGKYNSSLYK